jgi:hypothetical protein
MELGCQPCCPCWNGEGNVSIQIDSPEPKEKLDGLLAVWKQRCPVYLALIKARPVEVSLGCCRRCEQARSSAKL